MTRGVLPTFELLVQSKPDSEVKTFHVTERTFEDAVTVFLDRFPNTYKITDPCIYRSE